MACQLSNEQLDALYKTAVGEIMAFKARNEKFSPDAFIKKIYDAISTATGDTANALDYVQHIPWAINLAQGLDMEIADYLMDSGVSMDSVNKLRRDFDSIDNIIKYLGLGKNQELETVKEVIAENFPDTEVISTETYDQIEKEDQQLKKDEYSRIFKETNEGEFIAKPETALATINQEAKTYGGYKAKDNVVDDDPQKLAYFKVVRFINEQLAMASTPVADNLELGDITGIFFKAIPASQIAVSDTYKAEQEYLNRDDDSSVKNPRTSAQKLEDRNKNDVYLAFADKEGNIIYFDEAGGITSKEEGGKPLYTTARRVYQDKSGKKYVASVQSITDLSRKPGAFPIDIIGEERAQEIEVLEKLRDYIIKNPNETVLLSVGGGRNGYVKEDFSKRSIISSINLGGPFSLTYSTSSRGIMLKGGVYFTVSDYPFPVLVYRPKFSEVSGLVDALSNVLFDSSLSNQKKIAIVKQFTQSKDTSVFEEDGVVKVKQNEEVLDTTVKENKEKFVNNLNSQTVNINKDLMGRSNLMMPVLVDGKLEIQDNKEYDNFIADNFYTHLVKNAENKIVKLNAYNTFSLTEESTKKVFEVTQDKIKEIKEREKKKKKELYEREVKKEDREALDKIYNTGKIGDQIQIGSYVFTKTGEDEWSSFDDADEDEGQFSYSTEKLGNVYFDIEYGKTKASAAFAFFTAGILRNLDKLGTSKQDIEEIKNEPLIKEILKIEEETRKEIENLKNKKESSLEQATPSDQSVEDFKNAIRNIDTSLKKIKALDSNATDQQIAEAEEWYNNSPLKAHAPFKVMLNAINSDAKAEFTQAGIFLYQGSNFTDLYHEGWHVFSQMFLTKDQKKKLYGEMRKLSGTFTTVKGETRRFATASDKEIEEFLAEDFRKYVLSKGTKIFEDRPATNNIFKKIWNFLKALYKGQSIKRILADTSVTGTVKDLYDKLYIGNINEYKPSLANVQFTILNKGIQDLDATADQNKGMSYQESLLISETIDSLLVSNLNTYGLSVNTVFTNPELLAPVYAKIRYDIQQLKNKEGLSDEYKNLIDRAVENWGDFNKVIKGEEANGVIAFHKKNSEFLTFDERYLELSADERDEEDGNVGEDITVAEEDGTLKKGEAELRELFGVNTFEKTGRENSVREIASNQTVYLVKSLPRMDKNGKIEYNVLGVPKLAEFNRMWGILINSVAGSLNKTEMYDRMMNNANVFPELKVLAERLHNPMNKTNLATDDPYIKMWGAFFRDFSVYKIPIKELQIVKQISGGDVVFSVRFVEAEPLFQQVEKNFINYFQSTTSKEFIKRDQAGMEGVNVLDLDKVFKAFPTQQKALEGDNIFKFLKAIGFYMTDNKFVRDNISTDTNMNKVGYLYQRLKRAQEKGGEIITNPIAFFRKDEVTTNKEYKNFNGKNNGNDVKAILDVEGKYSTNYSNNSIINVKGDREYDLSLNNSATQFLKELNNARLSKYQDVVGQPHMRQYDFRRNPNAKYSIWLQSMFDIPVTYKEISFKNQGYRRIENGIASAINIVNLNGIKSIVEEIGKTQYSDGGIKTANLDGNSKFLFDLHTMLEAGTMEITRRASKSSSFGFIVSNLKTKYNDKDRISYVGINNFADPVIGIGNTIELLKEKLAAEMERIAIVKDDIKNNGELSKIPGFAQRAIQFTAFDDMLATDETLKDDLIKEADQENSFAVIQSKFKDRVGKALSTYLELLYQENLELYRDMPYLSQTMRNRVKKLAGVSDSKVEKVAVRAFTSNALIHNMEVAAIIDGDLANFNHDSEEYHKRNPYVTSTGRIYSFDQSDIKILNSEEYYNTTYAKKIGAAKKGFNGILNTVIFKDNKIGSIYLDEYVAAFVKTGKYTKEEAEKVLKPYAKGEMKEGDAQGWLTFDAYKKLSILEGNKWSTKQGELYNKIVAGEEVDEREVLEFFPPLKLQYGGPLQTEKLDVRAFHKFSLAPLIPSVIKGTNLETLHDNLVMQGVDYAVFESGSKLSTLTTDGSPDSFYEKDDTDKREMMPWIEGSQMYKKNPIFIQYLKNQVDVATKWKNKTIFSTQLRKLIINDLFLKGLPINSDFKTLVEDFEKTLNDLQSFKKQELLKEMGWVTNDKGEPTGDLSNLVKFVKKELSRQGLPDHVVEFVDLDDSGKKLRYDLSYSLAADKIEKLLNAIVVKRLINQKLNGEQLIQTSGAGFETSDRTVFTKASAETIKKYKGTNDLPTYRPGKGKDGITTAMKIKIAMKGDYYKLLQLNSVKDFAEKNNISALEALNKLIKTDDWLNEGDNRKLVTLVGVRIPVQGLNSMEFMEVYEFLPEEAGNILIPPAEIVAKSGSDFDIDKLTVFQPNYDSKKKHASYITSDNSVKGVENKVIENIRKILEHPENFDALVRPNDVDLVKGVADELEEKNIQGYDRFVNKTIKDTKINKKGNKMISPTRVLEPKYNNIYKHNSNNIGKATLGIGAVDNAYSSIFKRIGARLSSTYTFKPYSKTQKPHTRKVNIAFDHNKTVIDGEEFVSLSDINTVTKQKVSDLIGQLMNGWVDIEKDAWIFNINGNNIAGPVALFLIETGVDFRTAAYFVSQPLIVEYIKRRYQSDSPFYEASGKGKRQARGLNKYEIRKNMIKEFIGPLPTFEKKETGEIVESLSGESLYKKFIEPATRGKFALNELSKNIDSKNLKSTTSKKALLHFFELEDMMAKLTNIKLNVNVDTKPSKTFLDAQSRVASIDALNETDIVPQDFLPKIKKNSPISSFFIQKFQLNLFRPLMPLRANEKVNDFLIERVQNDDFKNAFDDYGKFSAAFKNDMPLYILQNYLKGINLDTIKEYSSISVDMSMPIKEVQLKYGAFVKGGVMYIDKAQIEEDFKNKNFAGIGYEKRGLHKVDPEYFSFFKNNQLDFQEYSHFVLEREFLRSVTSTEGKTREAFEKEIAEKALENTYNFYSILKSPNSIATVFNAVAGSVGLNISKDYFIFDQVVASKLKSDKGVNTLKLKNSKMDVDIVNVLHENLVRLSDSGTTKIPDSTRNENMSAFFRKFIIAEYLRSGITDTADSLSPILPTDVLMKLLKEPIQDFKVTDEFLQNYFTSFMKNWDKAWKDRRNKIRNYLKVDEVKVLAQVDPENFFVVRTNEKGVNLFNRPGSPSGVEAVITKNPGYTLIYATNQTGISEVLGDKYKTTSSIGIPIKPVGGAEQKWTDETYDENVKEINKALDLIEEAVNDDQPIAFPEDGVTDFVSAKDKKAVATDMLKQSAPRTFDYLVTELYKRFGYVNPGAEKSLGFRDVYQESQEISDKELDEFITKCFE